MSVAFVLYGLDVSLICVYIAVGDHFPGRRSERSLLAQFIFRHPAKDILQLGPFIDAMGFVGGEE